MVTRASTKRKRLNNTMVKNKKLKASRSPSDKRSQSTTKPQSITRSSISIHDGNMDNDNSSLDKDLLVIDCQDQPEHNRVSTPKKVVNSDSKDLNIKKGPLNSSVITKHSITEDKLNTEAAYKQLEAVISSCSPIVGRIPNNVDKNLSSFNSNGGSVVLDTEDQVFLPSPSSQITPTTNRINPHNSRVNRSKHHADQHLSPTTSARNNVNRIQLASNPITSSDCMRGSSSGIRHLNNNGLSHTNRNTNGTAKNNICSSINTQSTSTNDRVASQFAISFSSTNSALLESIPEYRSLKKEFTQEQQRCIKWSDDYNKLREEFENYRALSFPRPTVDGLNFLLQLVENLTASSISIDSRSRRELATAIGLTEEQLIGCCHPNPQRAALQVFSRLYPSYHERAKLVGIKKFSKTKSDLLDDIFVFARQCNPSTIYSMDKMREAIAASIRQAKHQLGKLNKIESRLSTIDNHHIVDKNDVEQINDDSNSIMDMQKQHLNNNYSRECSDDEFDDEMAQ